MIRVGDVIVRPDVVFVGPRVAVFVDGCFWHSCPEHGNVPTHNHTYWEAKLRRNVERDLRVDLALVAGGWITVRVWEHEDAREAAERVLRALQRPTGSSSSTRVPQRVARGTGCKPAAQLDRPANSASISR